MILEMKRLERLRLFGNLGRSLVLSYNELTDFFKVTNDLVTVPEV